MSKIKTIAGKELKKMRIAQIDFPDGTWVHTADEIAYCMNTVSDEEVFVVTEAWQDMGDGDYLLRYYTDKDGVNVYTK
jgi:hypothetical protein